jgi:hypothetical protein
MFLWLVLGCWLFFLVYALNSFLLFSLCSFTCLQFIMLLIKLIGLVLLRDYGNGSHGK